MMTNGIVNRRRNIIGRRGRKQRKVKTTHKVIEKEVVVAAVVDQIQNDLERDEIDALRMLVEYLPEGVLLAYLPDDYLDKDEVSYE